MTWTINSTMLRVSTILIAILAGGCSGGGDDDPPGTDGAIADAASDGAPDDGIAVDARLGCPATYATCSTFDDRTGVGSLDVTLVDEFYGPRCVRVSPGTEIRIGANREHPLRAASCSPSDFIGGPPGGVSSPATFTLTVPGHYGFYCPSHGTDAGAGMAGAIIVTE
jgi:plastocyanin